jgi:hypothetical protein
MATHSHRRHVPHISLFVAEDLPVSGALAAVGRVPKEPLRLLIESAGMFPEGNLFLAAIVTPALQEEQRRVHDLIEPMAFDPWPHFAPGTWTPHITTGDVDRPAPPADRGAAGLRRRRGREDRPALALDRVTPGLSRRRAAAAP